MNVQFLEPAQAEFREAVDYYNAQVEGLGFEFSDEVRTPSTESSSILKRGLWYQREQGAAGQNAFHMESSIRQGRIPCSSSP